MHKAILLMLLAAVSGSAAAEWIKVSDSTDGIYFDPGAIRRAGDMAKMWLMIDNKVAKEVEKGKPFKSMKIQYEFDCKEERLRQLYMSAHTGNMGDGEMLFSDSNPYKWEPFPPDSPYLKLWKIACAK